MLAWLNKAGMEMSVAAFFLGGVLIAYLGITRLVVQAGVFYLTTPVVSQAMTMMTFGTSAISPTGLGRPLGMSYGFFSDVQVDFYAVGCPCYSAARRYAHESSRPVFSYCAGPVDWLYRRHCVRHCYGLRAGGFQLQFLVFSASPRAREGALL